MRDDQKNSHRAPTALHSLSSPGTGLSYIALKADQIPPLWYRDSVQLRHLLEGAWENVSPDFVKELIAAFKGNDPAKIKQLIKGMPDLGSQMVDELGKGPDAIFSNLLQKSEAFWVLHAQDAGIEKPITIREKYRDLMAKTQADQVKAFAEKYPERILHPEIEKQLAYLQETTTPDAFTITSITERLERFETDEEYWKGISDVHVARAWHADGIKIADENGIKTGRIVGPMDEKTCPVCLKLIGFEINIAAMMDKIDEDLNIEDPDQYVEAWSFPRLIDVDNISPEELDQAIEENGWIPPFHPHCRHSVAWLYAKDQNKEGEENQDEGDQGTGEVA